MMKPVFKKPGAEIDTKLKSEIDKVRVEIEAKARAETDERIKTILKEKEDAERKEKADKITKAVDVAKAIKGDAEKDKADKADKLCPTCHDGHIHKLETDKSGLVWKCNGDKCGYEYVLVPKVADYRCIGCGMPIKKPDKDETAKEMDGCPFCHGKKAVKFDWSKAWNVKR